jgi:hypothetical protein
MAKQKQILPSIDDEPRTQIELEPPKPLDPVKSDDSGYLPRRVDVKLTRQQALVLRNKLRQLQDSGAQTENGRYVNNRTQAIQWILENEVAL